MFAVPCRCPPKVPIPQSQECMPCGKLAFPRMTEETSHDRKERLKPITDMLETDRRMGIRQNIENRAEIKKTQDIAKFCTANQMEESSMNLERKSENLKRMMDDEMFDYTQQILNTFEQQQDAKIELMRQRVMELRQQREEEDRRLVEIKLGQAFDTSCEQLRTLKAQRMAKEIAKDWEEQIKMKERLECEEEENDRMYAYLWGVDAENKTLLAEKGEKNAKARNQQGTRRNMDPQVQRRNLHQNVLAGRAQQMEDLKVKRAEEAAQNKLEDSKLKEDWKEYIRETESERATKIKNQQAYKRDLDCQVQYKNLRRQRELDEFQRENEVNDMQEAFFLDKLRATLAQAETKDIRANPFRQPLVGKHIKQCLRPV